VFLSFDGGNSGLLCKVLLLLTVDKIVIFLENNMDLKAYDGNGKMVLKMQQEITGKVCRNPNRPKPSMRDRN